MSWLLEVICAYVVDLIYARLQEPITGATLSNAFNMKPFLVRRSVHLTSPHQLRSLFTSYALPGPRIYRERRTFSRIRPWYCLLPPPSSMSLLMTALDEIPKAGPNLINHGWIPTSRREMRYSHKWMNQTAAARFLSTPRFIIFYPTVDGTCQLRRLCAAFRCYFGQLQGANHSTPHKSLLYIPILPP
ncbi:unnamed protein product [Rhizoctonia solani]|uniref:Uncharacterized protein n=1 Tax=Rhizoctonia solani TaxID=456999 RepID=A0A8H3DMX8_9AGAM|nr:unnamed protein product [Rhizoctonia solani]